MRKKMAVMCVGIMIFNLVAQSAGVSVVNAGENQVQGKEPQLVETVYETKDAVIADYIPTEMGYDVDPTGTTDSTAGIKKALNDCYEAGGGTVYLSAGNYIISDTIYIPPYVTLRGDWQDPDVGTEYGTIISVRMESADTEDGGAFSMGGSAGAVGLTVYYPLQSLESVVPYPYTFYVDGKGVNFALSTIRNVTIINGYRGIGTSSANPHELLQVENVKGTFLYCGIGAANSSDVGTMKNVVISNKYWKEAAADCMNAVSASGIDAYTGAHTTGLTLGDLEWTEFSNITVEGCAIGIHTVPGTRIQFAGSMCDINITNCAQGLVVDGLDPRWGAVIARSHIEGGIVHNTEGKIKLCDVEVIGGITEQTEGSVVIDETDLSQYEIAYENSYVKPAANMIVADIASGLSVDAGPGLQACLDEMARKGGGVVYVPGGTYRFDSPVTVPAGVELRGSSSVGTRELAGSCRGTLFFCYYGDDSSDGIESQAFITLAGKNAGMNGIRIIYPENGPKDDNLNSTYTVRGTASGVYVVNSMIAGSAYGIDFRNCDRHYIEGVVTCCYYNAFYLGGTGGTVTKCLQNGTVLVRTSANGLVDWITERDLFTLLINPILREKCQYIKIENATDQLVYDNFAYGCKTLVASVGSENTYLNNIGSDNLESASPQIYVDGGSVFGVNLMRYNGYSFEIEKGSLALHNRITINEAGEEAIEIRNGENWGLRAPGPKEWKIISTNTGVPAGGILQRTNLGFKLNDTDTAGERADFALYLKVQLADEAAVSTMQKSVIEVAQNIRDNAELYWNLSKGETLKVGENVLLLKFSEAEQTVGDNGEGPFDLSKTVNWFRIYNITNTKDWTNVTLSDVKIVYLPPVVKAYSDGATAGTAPTDTPEGYLFAGWYTNKACSVALSGTTSEPVFAKFVNADILSVKTQYKMGGGLYTDCDSTKHVILSNNLAITTEDKKEGTGAFVCSALGHAQTASIGLSSGIDGSAYQNGRLHLWLYISDPNALNDDRLWIELGGSETKRLRWAVRKAQLTGGWNELYLKMSSAHLYSPTTADELDYSNIDFLRIYLDGAGSGTPCSSLVIKLDDIRLVEPLPGVTISDCDNITGMEIATSHVLVLEKAEVKEGMGALKNTSAQQVRFQTRLGSTTDISEYITEEGSSRFSGAIHFYLYVNDPTKFNGSLRVGIGSGGEPENAERKWKWQGTLSAGWNEITLPFSDSFASQGDFDPERVNFFRIYQESGEGTNGLITIIDDIRVLPEGVSGEEDPAEALTAYKADVRFVTTADTLNYHRIGFDIKIANTKSFESNKVYTGLHAMDTDGTILSYHPISIAPQSNYFYTYTIRNIPKAAFDTPIQVTPYWITQDGTKVNGTSRTLTVNELLAAFCG